MAISFKKLGVIVSGASVALASSSAFAEASANITSAVTQAGDDVGAVTAGVIAISALGFGLGMIVSWLRH